MTSPDEKSELKTYLTRESILSIFLPIAYKFIRNKTEAEDIVQDAILDALQQPEKEIRKPLSFLKHIVAVKAKSRYTKEVNKKEILTGDYPIISEPAETLFQRMSFAELFKTVEQNRDETDCKLFRMSYNGYSYEEIANETGETANNLRQRMFVLRKWLKDRYRNK